MSEWEDDIIERIFKLKSKKKRKYTEYGSQMHEKTNNMSNTRQKMFRPGCVVSNGKSHGLNLRKVKFDDSDCYSNDNN